MRLTEMRIRNYRTVGAEQTLKVPSGTTLVGPNNSGKTNLLRAMQMFFTGYDNTLGYDRSTDLTFGAGSQKTSLVGTFEFDDHPRDQDVKDLLNDLHSLVGTKREGDRFSINLYFTEVSTPVYRVFGNAKVLNESDRPAFSRKQKSLVEIVMSTYRVHYVPSAKSIDGLYEDLLQPFLTEAAFRAISPHLDGVKSALSAVSDSLNQQLAAVGLGGISSEFNLEPEASAKLLSGFELILFDPSKTPLSEKGQGIQSTALFASFNWIAEQEKAAGTIPLWLIEEPESYLHPELSKACKGLLDQLATTSPVVLTTHALGFVPTSVGSVQGVDVDAGGHTIVTSFATHTEATQRIRASLGVQFSDYYNLGAANVFVEGRTDLELIRWACTQLTESFPIVESSLVEEFGGVKQLEGFLRAVLAPIRAERAVVAVFDGDEPGQRTRQALQQYFSNKQQSFAPNRDFVSVRSGFAIEALFPDTWIIEAQDEHPGWFQTYSLDTAGALEPFQIKDRNKDTLINHLKRRAEAELDSAWTARWVGFLSAIEEALGTQLDALAIARPIDRGTDQAQTVVLA